jgi:hypothetical protein
LTFSKFNSATTTTPNQNRRTLRCSTHAPLSSSVLEINSFLSWVME